jgi:hypothetical protein
MQICIFEFLYGNTICFYIYIYLRDLAICSPIKQNFVFFLSEKNSREVFWYFLKFQRKTDTSI